MQILKASLVAASLALCGLVDLETGYEISLFPLYALPIGLGGWFFGTWLAVAMAGMSAVIWAWADVVSGHVYSKPWIFYLNAGARLTYFLLIAIAVRYALGSRHRSRTPEPAPAVCSGCGKIRDADGYWQDRKGISHLAGDPIVRTKLCADCARRVYAAGDPPASFSEQ